MPLFNVKKAVEGQKTARKAGKGQSAQPTPFEVLTAKYESLQAQHEATVGENTRLYSKVRYLEKENDRVSDDTAKDKPRVMPGQKTCAECDQSAPDSFAFFGSAANDPDKTKCAACSRRMFHESGVRHYSAGCAGCMSDGYTGEIRDGVLLKWMED